MIRIAQEKDLPFINDIYNDAVLHTTATFDTQLKTAAQMNEWFLMHSDHHVILVYEKGEKAVGYASLSPYRPHNAYEHSVELSIYVEKESQKQGIGKALMTEILAFAKNHPKIHTVLSVISSENEESIRFHQNFGFCCCGQIKDAGYKFGRFLSVTIYQMLTA